MLHSEQSEKICVIAMTKFLVVIILMWAPCVFGQASSPESPCPNGTTSIYTHWAPQDHSEETACVAISLVTILPTNGFCPNNYTRTQLTESAHRDVCVSVVATYLPRVPEKLSSEVEGSSTDRTLPRAPPQEDKRWVMFANNPWPDANLQSQIAQACGAPFQSDLPPTAATQLEVIAIRLNEGRSSLGFQSTPIVIAPLKADVVNAWALSNLGGYHAGVVCLLSGIQQVLDDAPEELAAVIAHEMGHALDSECWNYGQRTINGQRSCEARADSIGLAILIRAGYNPFAFAGFFGRFEMYSGDISTSLLSRLVGVISSNHPITPDRIQHLRQMLIDNQQGKFILPGNRIVVPPAVP